MDAVSSSSLFAERQAGKLTVVPARFPSMLADPAPRPGRTWITNARLFDAIGGPIREDAAVLVEDGVIAAVGRASDGTPEGAAVVDLAGRTLMPGLIDTHAHLFATLPTARDGAEPSWPGAASHVLAAGLREALRMGFTTLRDVGSYGDEVVSARQAMRYRAFAGPRVLTCGRIVSATAPGGRFFDGMYREADGPDEMRKAVREQVRRGADFVKVMCTGARSVELEDPDPAQVTRAELAALVEEAHRLGVRVAAHAEGLAGTELAVSEGVDTIEHGIYLAQRPDLLDAMAAAGQTLVPTLSCFYGVAGLSDQIGTDRPPVPGHRRWTQPLVELAHYNLAEADKTLRAAHAAGVPIALGHDWQPFADSGIELLRMIHHGLTPHEALLAATAIAAHALGLQQHIGTVEPGKIADLIVLDGDPLQDAGLFRERERIWLVFRLGQPVAGAALEASLPAAYAPAGAVSC